MEYFLHVVRDNFANFEGRARRKEYWMFVAIYIAIYIGVGIVGSILGMENLLVGLLSLALFVPSLAVAVRRLHDIGKSGWWALVGFIPLVGWIWAIVLLATEGEVGANIYGEDPKALEANF